MLSFQQENNLLSFHSPSEYSFESDDCRIVLNLKPLDERIKSLLITASMHIKSQLYLQFEEILDFHDFFPSRLHLPKQKIIGTEHSLDLQRDSTACKYNKEQQQNTKQNQQLQGQQSLLWIKLYIDQYFKSLLKFQGLVFSHQSKKLEKDQIKAINFSKQTYLRKVYRSKKKVTKIIQDSNQCNLLELQSQNSQVTQISNNYLKSNDQIFVKSMLLHIDPFKLNFKTDIFSSPFIINLPRKLKSSQRVTSTLQIQNRKKSKRQNQIQNIFFDNKLDS